MKKYLLPLFAILTVNAATAQFITTNPATTPVTVGSDLNLAASKYLKFNGQTIMSNAGTSNLFLGVNAGAANTGAGNLFVGDGAGQLSTTGASNVFIGASAGFNNVGGSNNLFFGTNAGRSNSGGIYNIFIGEGSGQNNGNANRNIAIGTAAGFSNTGGDSNVQIGNGAGRQNTAGAFNVVVGQDAGFNNQGTNNTFVGYNAGNSIANASITNATAIGFNANVAASNSIVLGNGVANVGINTSAPLAKLHVVGAGTTATGVRFEGLPTDIAAGGATTQYVTIDANGNLYKYISGPTLRQGVSETSVSNIPTSFTENWTLKNDFLYNKNKKGIIIGEGITSLPKGYGMYVTDGILTEKVKVAIKNTSDWADYVFNKNYKKMSLTEVEKFIAINKHLPNVPSAAEMVSEGNDLAKTDAKLLAKIEELTLYMIDMKKENAQMKRQINTLKRKMK
jgi:trimeric autotransporter adhesin